MDRKAIEARGASRGKPQVPRTDQVMSLDRVDYLRALDRIYDLPRHVAGRTDVFVPTREERLERIRFTRDFLDRALPGWRRIRVAHVAGTAGKGSTAWMLASMLSRHHTTGLVTSPHLFDLRERIRLGMRPISRRDLVRVFEGTVVPACERLVAEDDRFALRFPEVILATAFAHFLERGAEWAVIEVTIGGRLDQSNVVEPAVSIVTNVSRDHVEQLGPRIEDIARHKAGIAKPGVPLYTTETKGRVLAVIEEECRRVGAPLVRVTPEGGGEGEGELAFRGRRWALGMRGRHQRLNAALAVAVAMDVAGLPEADCAAGLARARMPGRFDEVEPGVYADIAHNGAKMRALVNIAREALEGRRVVFVLGISEGKDPRAILNHVASLADGVVLTRARYRGLDPHRLMRVWARLGGEGGRTEVVEGPRSALARARRLAGRRGAVIVTGSTFVVDEALNPDTWLMEANADYVPPGVSTVSGGQKGAAKTAKPVKAVKPTKITKAVKTAKRAPARGTARGRLR
jgi:dihydrofolate synthase/folylpolyglutamate synthase